MLRVRFWGVRGSVPAPLPAEDISGKIESVLRRAVQEGVKSLDEVTPFLEGLPAAETSTLGGNTACVVVSEDEDAIVLDAGTGLRRYGHYLAAQGQLASDRPIHIILSHYHWDHIMGFCFFAPAFAEGNQIILHSPRAEAREYFKIQHSHPFFPVELEHMGAELKFMPMNAGLTRRVAHFDVLPIPLAHPGGGLGYRVDGRAGCVVYLTDTEMEQHSPEETSTYVDFARGADVAVVDSQYSLFQTIEKLTWGHSSILRFIDMLHDADVKTLVMFHYDPDTSDTDVADLLDRARRYTKKMYPDSPMQIEAAAEGKEIAIGEDAD